MEPPFATARASQEKGACASVAWFSHRLGAVTSLGTLEVILSVYREVESHNMTLQLSAPTQTEPAGHVSFNLVLVDVAKRFHPPTPCVNLSDVNPTGLQSVYMSQST